MHLPFNGLCTILLFLCGQTARSLASPCGICGEQSGIGTEISPSTSVFLFSITTSVLRTLLFISDVVRSQQLTVSINKTSLSSRILHFRFNIAHVSFGSAWVREKYKSSYESSRDHLQIYRDADKSSARPGRKKKLDESSRLDVVEIVRVPNML